MTLGALAAYGGDFGATLGSLWGQFGYLWVTLHHLMVTLQSLWGHFGYMKVRFQKTFVFRTYFNDFIKLLGELWMTLGHFGVTFARRKRLWGHFGTIFRI